MLGSVSFCYLFYYTGRHNFGFAVKALQDSDGLGLSAAMTGTIGSAMLLCYGIGQAINGNLGDQFGARRMMSLGAILSVALTWATSFGRSFTAFLIPWSANGYVQSLGWAPGSRLISNWWARHERGRAFGLYLMASSFSSILTFTLCILVLKYLDWRWLFRLPVLLLLVGGIVFYLVARDKPEDLGFPPLPEDGGEDAPPEDDDSMLRRYVDVFAQRRFLLACLAIGCESFARWGLLFWVPAYYLGENWKQEPGNAWITLSLPVGMALGGPIVGYVSDRLFHANRSRPAAIFLALAAVVMVALYFVPKQEQFAGLLLLFLAGLLVYGPQAPLWALCPDLLGTRRAGTGVGVMDACAYVFAAGQGVVIGAIIDATGNDGLAFLAVAAACLLGAIIVLPVKR